MKRASLTLVPLLTYLSFFTATVPASFVHVPQPLIGSVRVADVTSGTATISWLTSVSADSQVAYGTTDAYGSLTGLDSTRTRTHVQYLSALAPGALYHFEVLSRTATGNLYSAGDFTFSTAPLVIPGLISGLSVSGITMSSAVVSWTTASPANAIVEYGNSFSYGQFSQLAPEFATSHTIVLSGLNPQSLYHFRARSTNVAGDLGITADSTFSTSEDDTPALFAGISASEVGTAAATIVWTTNAPASTQVDYGTGADYGKSTSPDTALVTSHSQTLAGLTATPCTITASSPQTVQAIPGSRRIAHSQHSRSCCTTRSSTRRLIRLLELQSPTPIRVRRCSASRRSAHRGGRCAPTISRTR